VTLTQSNSPTALTLSWPSWAVGFNAEASANLISWSPVTPLPGLTADHWSVSVFKTNATQMLRLKR